MRWETDNSRIDEGRFICPMNKNQKESLREFTIFEEIRLPITQSFRLLFKEFVDQAPAATAAFRLDCDWRTVQQHYNFARRVIHNHMERTWMADPKG
jgi:hypothetical protein